MGSFLSGAFMLGSWVASLCFFRFWRKTHDRLFQIFGFAFSLMAIERFMLEISSPQFEHRPYIYLIRMSAFLIIAYGILNKNRERAGVATQSPEERREKVRIVKTQA